MHYPISKTKLFITLAALLGLASCLFDKPREEVDLTLTHVPDGTNRIRIVVVERSDTSKVLDELYSRPWTGGTIHFALGIAQGKDCFLRVEGYQDTFLVYMSLIHPEKNSTDAAFFPNVDASWPAVVITGLERDTIKNQAVLTSVFRNPLPGMHWVITPNVPANKSTSAINPGLENNPLIASEASFGLGRLGLIPGTYIVNSLRDDNTNKPLPVQLPDTILTDEALAPAGSSVTIIETIRKGDSLEIRLQMKNFAYPVRDEPAPGRGWPMVHDARGLRILPEFKFKPSDFTRLYGPVWALDGVNTIVVALHYANGLRIRPLVAASIPAATALLEKGSLPTVKFISHEKSSTSLQVVFSSTNMVNGRHFHVFKDQLNSDEYQLCRSDTCMVDSTVWTGANRLIAAIVNEDHSLFAPQSTDTLISPF